MGQGQFLADQLKAALLPARFAQALGHGLPQAQIRTDETEHQREQQAAQAEGQHQLQQGESLRLVQRQSPSHQLKPPADRAGNADC